MTGLERKIVDRLVAHLLACGYRISVNDGEETVLRYSDDPALIIQAMASTSDDTLIVHETVKQGDGLSYRRIGWVRLIWGNGIDLISDSSIGLIEDALRPVEDWVNEIEASGAAWELAC